MPIFVGAPPPRLPPRLREGNPHTKARMRQAQCKPPKRLQNVGFLGFPRCVVFHWLEDSEQAAERWYFWFAIDVRPQWAS